MSISDMEKKLNNAVQSFAENAQFDLKNCACDEDTKAALDDLARQIFYALDEFRNVIIDVAKAK